MVVFSIKSVIHCPKTSCPGGVSGTLTKTPHIFLISFFLWFTLTQWCQKVFDMLTHLFAVICLQIIYPVRRRERGHHSLQKVRRTHFWVYPTKSAKIACGQTKKNYRHPVFKHLCHPQPRAIFFFHVWLRVVCINIWLLHTHTRCIYLHLFVFYSICHRHFLFFGHFCLAALRINYGGKHTPHLLVKSQSVGPKKNNLLIVVFSFAELQRSKGRNKKKNNNPSEVVFFSGYGDHRSKRRATSRWISSRETRKKKK